MHSCDLLGALNPLIYNQMTHQCEHFDLSLEGATQDHQVLRLLHSPSVSLIGGGGIGGCEWEGQEAFQEDEEGLQTVVDDQIFSLRLEILTERTIWLYSMYSIIWC